jgi:hypothetical protein
MAKKKPYESQYLKYTLGGSQGYNPAQPQTVTTPAAPSTPAPQPFHAPDIRDASYNDQINSAWTNLGDTTASVAGQQALLRGRYGYADNNFTLDPSNPFGQAQLLTRAYQQSQAGTRNGYAARGQQTSGAYGRAQRGNLFNFQQRNDALQKSFLQDNASLLGQLTQANVGYRDAASQAAADALARSIQARNPGGQPAPVDTDPIVNVYYDANGNKVNVHASGRKATIKKKR